MKIFVNVCATIAFGLLIVTCGQCLAAAHDDLTPEEWAAIRASEEQEAREKKELEEAIKLSLEGSKKAEQQSAELKRRQELEAQHKLEVEQQPKKAQESVQKELKPTLEPLTPHQRGDGSSETRYYNRTYDFKKLHAEGNIVGEQFLLDGFQKTLFQYYTFLILGFDLTQNYKNIKYLQQDAVLFKDFANPFNPAPFRVKYTSQTVEGKSQDIMYLLKPYIPSIFEAIDKLKQNILLKDLGIAYMRQKIVVEKIYTCIEAGNSSLQPLLIKQDRYAEDLQTMIYHFMREAYASYTSKFGTLPSKTKAPAPDNAFLITYVPTFTQEPYYAAIISKLKELGAPKSDADLCKSVN